MTPEVKDDTDTWCLLADKDRFAAIPPWRRYNHLKSYQPLLSRVSDDLRPPTSSLYRPSLVCASAAAGMCLGLARGDAPCLSFLPNPHLTKLLPLPTEATATDEPVSCGAASFYIHAEKAMYTPANERTHARPVCNTRHTNKQCKITPTQATG